MNLTFIVFLRNQKNIILPRILISVTNDLVTDQRVRKVCQTLAAEGYNIVLIGRKLKDSLPIERPYSTKRLRLIFNKGFCFYAEYNLRLFILLFFLKKDILLSNDLDTLLPNFLIAKLFGKKLVYDSHELFTEVPELTNRTQVRNVWLRIEKFIFPKLENVITVNQVIADIYEKKYKVPVIVIRNIAPKLQNIVYNNKLAQDVKGDKKMLILQGSGINKDRGAEEAVQMMQYLEGFILVIIGSGDVFEELKELIKQYNLVEKVKILGRLPYDQLLEYTKIADLGLSLDKGTNLNYEYSLPNKVFDYIQCRVPLFVSNRKVVAQLVENEQIGQVFDNHDPKKMAEQVKHVFDDKNRYQSWKTNLEKAAQKYNWENESQKLIDLYRNLR